MPQTETQQTEAEIIAEIAREHLGFESLEVRNIDSHDFRQVAVWNLEAALEAALEAGKRIGAQTAKGATR